MLVYDEIPGMIADKGKRRLDCVRNDMLPHMLSMRIANGSEA